MISAKRPIRRVASMTGSALGSPAKTSAWRISGSLIYGPDTDGSYFVEVRKADGESLAISVPGSEAAVTRYFQERMPCGLFVPDIP